MKLAVSGKGGVGKTTFSALLIRTLDAQGKRVLAIDADPDANLASALGIPDAEKIVPIAEMKDLTRRWMIFRIHCPQSLTISSSCGSVALKKGGADASARKARC